MDGFFWVSGAWQSSFNTNTDSSLVLLLAACEEEIYFTAARQVFHTAALLSGFPATLYSSEWTGRFIAGWWCVYSICFLLLMFLTKYQQTTYCICLTTLAEIKEGVNYKIKP